MDECCLCSRSVGTGSRKKKRKKLYGSCCSASRGVLERLADKLTGGEGSKRLAEMKGPQTFLCHVCDGKLLSIARHEEQLTTLRAEVITWLQCALHPEDTPRSTACKRPSEHASAVSRKAPRVDLDPQLCLRIGQSQPAPSQQVTYHELHSTAAIQQRDQPSTPQQQTPGSQDQPSPLQQPLHVASREQPSWALQQPTSRDLPSPLQQPLASREQPSWALQQPTSREQPSRALQQPTSRDLPSPLQQPLASREQPSRVLQQPTSRDLPSPLQQPLASREQPPTCQEQPSPLQQPPTSPDQHPPTSPDQHPPTSPEQHPLTSPDQHPPTSPDCQHPLTSQEYPQQRTTASQGQPSPPQKLSPAVTVTIGYPSGRKCFKVTIPARKHNVKKLARRSYASLASTMVKCSSTSTRMVTEVAWKIKAEMRDISSQHHESILLDTVEAVKHFSWETVITELQNMTPTLMHLLMNLIRNPSKNKPLLCLLASQLLKHRFPKLGLVQRAVSVLLYGNGTNKQVYGCLQPMMVCMSYYGTLKVVDRLCEDHDIEVEFWGDELKTKLDERTVPESTPYVHKPGMVVEFPETDDQSDDNLSDDDLSISAPPYSPLTVSTNCSEVLGDDLESDIGEEESISSEDEQCEVGESTEKPSMKSAEPWCGFKIVGDNIDKNVRPSHQRLDRQTQSLHHFHSFAVRDRINMSTFSDCAPTIPHPIDPATITPTASDLASFQRECEIFVSRILVQHMPEFQKQDKEVVWHISNEHAQEMAEKSTVIPLGVILHNENKLDEMSKIMEALHKYVPTHASEGQLTLPNGSTLPYDNTTFFEILMGGDQLTVARVAGVQSLRVGHETAVDRLEGLVPVVEDWHARVILLEVVWKRLYSSKSAMDKGTMYHLRNVVNRSVPADPSDNVKAAEDFLLLLVHAHVLASARILYSLHGTTSVLYLAKSVVATYLRLPQLQDDQSEAPVPDGVHVYALDFLSLGLLWVGFHDAIKEGNGDRVKLYWKLLLVVFKASNRPNYLKEAVKLLLQQEHLFSERKRMQLLWSRFVNTKGRTGCNIPCDLHMEHLNRRIKTILRNLGSNINPASIARAGKSLGAVHHVCEAFEQETLAQSTKDHHPYPDFGMDLEKVLQVLEEVNIFLPQTNRFHPTFPHLKKVLLEKLTHKELLAKVKTSIQNIMYSMS